MLGLSLSCRKEKPVADYVARVGENCLSRAQLAAMMPQGLLPADSVEMAEKKIAAWVSQEVLFYRAQENLDEETSRRIESQIEDYRKSLLIFNYENKITRQLLDTVVSEGDIEAYYRDNRAQFLLKSNIVRVMFVKVSKKSKHLVQIKSGLFSSDLEEGDNLSAYAELCGKYAENYFLDRDKWLYFNDFLREVPVRTYNQEDFLKNHRDLEVEAGDKMFYVRILDFKIRDMVSPLSFEKDRIRAIILNQRKRNLLQEMEKDLMQEAVSSGLVDYNGGLEDEIR